MADIKTYTEETQELFLRFLLSDPDLFARCQNIVKPDYFNLKYNPFLHVFLHHLLLYFFSLQALTAFEIISKSISRYLFLLKPTFDCVVPIAARTISLPSITSKYELKSMT